jgi:hypothetical protein
MHITPFHGASGKRNGTQAHGRDQWIASLKDEMQR